MFHILPDRIRNRSNPIVAEVKVDKEFKLDMLCYVGLEFIGRITDIVDKNGYVLLRAIEGDEVLITIKGNGKIGLNVNETDIVSLYNEPYPKRWVGERPATSRD